MELVTTNIVYYKDYTIKITIDSNYKWKIFIIDINEYPVLTTGPFMSFSGAVKYAKTEIDKICGS